MKVVGLVAVRMGSQRLPGKSLIKFAGKPLLGHLIARLGACPSIDETVVATTILQEDDAICDYATTLGVHSFRGAANDVLDRITGAARERDADICVVVYGDGPLIDPDIIDFAVRSFVKEKNLDFLGNDLKSTFPSGMEVEVIRYEALAKSNQLCVDQSTREHGTLFIRQNPEVFSIENFEAEGPQRRPDLFLEVDEERDLKVVEAVAAHLIERNSYALDTIIRFVDDTKLSNVNSSIFRRYLEFRRSS